MKKKKYKDHKQTMKEGRCFKKTRNRRDLSNENRKSSIKEKRKGRLLQGDLMGSREDRQERKCLADNEMR